ncbi:hypothetical protein AB0I30_16450 [Nocardia tengchongensis]|uniref:hypothetical protein n=1 Tax=Nocardia tengchongensis TaxID=2055889 RepID=UPI0033E2C126
MHFRAQYYYPLAVIQHVLEKHFSTAPDDWISYFRMAAEMAVFVEVSHHTLSKADQQRLRRPWESLLQPDADR